ncbi:DUF4248 domain-containing protein [Bacteroides fragilis]|uniref:DUF4248 domain-containing protein n=1 Tax=Bacteroides fragilis TaxID=817 RepID=UPI00202FC253|nr:DUF4248 domain-containing protein [Bacteroides fragilis]MCM0275910.1 DUF4248 domain-containing protein [Bacteroides fragilis]
MTETFPASKTGSNGHQITTSKHIENRAYGIKELAVLYFPNISPASASKRLKQWICESPELLTQLNTTNYHLYQRIISPLQTSMVIAAFGSPF